MTNITTMQIEGIDVEVSRKRMKNIRLKVCPPSGEVKVSAPFHVANNSIKQLVCDQKEWIARERERLKLVPHLVASQLNSGDSQPVFGVPYTLQIAAYAGQKQLVVDREQKTITMHLQGNSLEEKIDLIDKYYRSLIQARVPCLLEKWQPVVGKSVNEWRIRKMKTRWGSCNIDKRRIWLNLELAKLEEDCLEYVLVHELTHLHERYHNKRFYYLMDNYLSNWREIKTRMG